MNSFGSDILLQALGTTDHWIEEVCYVVLLYAIQTKPTILSQQVDGELDLIYLSAAMAHLLTPSFFEKHRGAHTQLILETVQYVLLAHLFHGFLVWYARDRNLTNFYERWWICR